MSDTNEPPEYTPSAHSPLLSHTKGDDATQPHPSPTSEAQTAKDPSPTTIRNLVWIIQQTIGIQWICLIWMTQKVIMSDSNSSFDPSVTKPLHTLWPWQFIFAIFIELFRLRVFAEFLNPNNTDAERDRVFSMCYWMRMYHLQTLGQYGVGGVVGRVLYDMIKDTMPEWLQYVVLITVLLPMVLALIAPEVIGDSFILSKGYKRLALHVNSVVKAFIIGLCVSTGAVGSVWFVAYAGACLLFFLLDRAVYRREDLPRRVREFVFSEEFGDVYYTLLILAVGFVVADFLRSGEDIRTRLGYWKGTGERVQVSRDGKYRCEMVHL